MKLKKLGHSGLYVSELVLGTMTFGDGTSEADCKSILAKAIDTGINLVDTADLYAGGHTEEILNPILKPYRNDILLATKGYFPLDKNPNHRGSTRLHLMQAIDYSLRRLGTDTIDIYYLHRFDEDVPLEQTLRTMDDAIRAGKIRYLGFSNFSAWQIEKALSLQDKLGLNRAIVIQPQYNLLKRQAESEILPCAQAEGLGVLTYSPLAAGLLTGKYLQHETGRMTTNHKYQMRFSEPELETYIRRFVQLAADTGYTPAELAMAWVCANPKISAPIIGTRTMTHLDSALRALEIPMTEELYAHISACTPAAPPATDRLEERTASAFSYV